VREGNGNSGPINLRGLLPGFKRVGRPPRGPFSGADFARALDAAGWRQKPPEPNEWHVYRHPEKPGQVIINPDWMLWEDEPAFRCVCWDMGISANQLLALLG